MRAEELRGSSPRHHRGGPRRQVLPARARYCGLAAAGERGARPSAPCPRRSAARARASSRTRERVTLLGAARHTLPKVPRCSHCLPLAIATTARASAAGRLRSAAAPPTSPAGRTEKQRTGGGGHTEKKREEDRPYSTDEKTRTRSAEGTDLRSPHPPLLHVDAHTHTQQSAEAATIGQQCLCGQPPLRLA